MKAPAPFNRLPLLVALAAASGISSSQAAVLDLEGPWSPGPTDNQWLREVHTGLLAMVSLTGVSGPDHCAFSNDGTFALSGDPAKNPFLTYTLSLHRRDANGSLVSLLPGEFTGVSIEVGDLDSQVGSHIADVWGLRMPENGSFSLPGTLTDHPRFMSIANYTQFSLRQDLWSANLLGDGPVGSDNQREFTATVNLPYFQSGDFVFGVTTPNGVPEGGPTAERGFMMRISGNFTPIPEPSGSALAAMATGILLKRRRRA